MAMSSSAIQPVTQPAQPQSNHPVGGVMASLLSMVMLSVYAGQKSKKQLRKLKRKMTWLLIKEKLQNAFSSARISDRKLLIYILLGIALLILLIYYPIAALILAIVLLILLLTNSI